MNPLPPVSQAEVSDSLPAPDYHLRLFVSGSTPTSVRAIRNIREFCDEKLRGHYALEVVDIYQHPEEIEAEEIMLIPTLIRKLPLPMRKIIGDFSDPKRILDLIMHSAGFPREPLDGPDCA